MRTRQVGTVHAGFSQRLFLTQCKQIGVSLCLLRIRAWQPLELPAKLLRISSATQPPALHSQRSFSPRDIVLTPAQGLVQPGVCPVDPEARKLYLTVAGTCFQKLFFPQGILASFTSEVCIYAWSGVCCRDKGTTGLKAECLSSLKSCFSDWEHWG